MKTLDRPNKRDRRKAQLATHYATCERLALALGTPAARADGKKISTALFNLETNCHAAAVAYCNAERVHVTIYAMPMALDFGQRGCKDWEHVKTAARSQIYKIFGRDIPGFFVNGDARGHALKIDPDNAEGKALIDSCRLHRDWGQFGVLSPELED